MLKSISKLGWTAYGLAALVILVDQLSKYWILYVYDLPSRISTPIAGPLAIGGPTNVATSLAKEFLYGLMALLVLVALLVPAAQGTWWGRALDSPVMRWAGRLSYAFFLWHTLVLHYVRQWLGLTEGDGGLLVSLLGTTVLTLVICQLSWWFVERPPLKWAGASTA